MRDGFIIHEKTIRMMSRLDPEDVGYLVACMATYYREGEIDLDEVESVSVAVAVILEDAIERMDADAAAYEKSVEQRKKAAEKRWSNANDMRKDAAALRDDASGMRNGCDTDAKNADSVSVSVIKEKSILKDTKKERFKKPTVDEVREYCLERKNNIDPEAFVAFYESKRWKVGNTPMKDWKCAITTWEKRQKAKAPPGKVNKFQNFPVNEGNRDLIRQIMALQ